MPAPASKVHDIGERTNRGELVLHPTPIIQEIEMEGTISTEDLKAKLERRKVTVVETLAPERYRENHLPGALNIPPERINELAPQLLPNKDADIVTYCTNTH